MDFEDFYGKYVDRVASYVLRHTSLRDAEDIVAETFTVAWRKRIERLDDPMPWLIVTARNITRQVRRKEVSAGEITARLIDLIETSSPSAEITALRRREITEALAGLDEVSREALLLTTWDGLSGIDAARVLGITPGALPATGTLADLVTAVKKLRAAKIDGVLSAEVAVQNGAFVQVDVVANVPGLREKVVEVVGASIPLAISPALFATTS